VYPYGIVKNFTNATTHLRITINANDAVPMNVYATRVRNIIYLYKNKFLAFKTSTF